MDWKKTVGFGIVFWVAMLAIVSAMIAFDLYESGGEDSIPAAILAGVVSYVLAGFAKPKSMKEALTFGAAWVIVGVALDWLITTKFAPGIFGMWTLWLGYALVLVAPALRVKKA